MYPDNDDDFLAGMFETPAPVVTPKVFENDDSEDTIDFDIDTPTPDAPAKVAPKQSTAEDDTIVRYVEFLKQNELLEIPEDYEFNGKPEQLEELFAHTKKSMTERAVENIFDALPEQFKPLFDYALQGGASLEDYYKTFVSDPLDVVDIESSSDQKRILKEHYKQFTKFTDEQIDRRIAMISDEEDLKLEAYEAFNDLKDVRREQQARFMQETAQQAAQEKLAIEQRTLDLSKAIDNTTLVHPQRKNKVKTFFFEPINVEGQVTTGFNHTIQSILSTPEHQAQLADILLEYDSTNGFSQERLEKKVKSKASQSFQRMVEDVLQTKQAKQKTASPANSEFN